MTDSKTDMQLVLELIKHAKDHGIAEITYGELKVRFSLSAQLTGSGPVHLATTGIAGPSRPAPLTWGTNIKHLEEK